MGDGDGGRGVSRNTHPILLDSTTGTWYYGTMANKMTVEIEEELLQRLRLVAVKERKTLSEIVRGLIGAYVSKKEAEGV